MRAQVLRRVYWFEKTTGPPQSAIGGIYVRAVKSQPASVPRGTADRGPKKFENSHFVQFAGSPASEQSSHHAANQFTWTAAAAVMVSTTPAATTGRTVVIGFIAAAEAGVRRRDGLGQ